MANNKEIAHQILTAVGGASNLKDATHCMTRLRLYLKDDSIPKDEEVKAIGGVLGVVRGGQQYQVIIGTNVPKVYEELCKLANLTANAPVEDAKAAAEDAAVAKPKLTPKQVGKNIMGYMAGCMTPLIPVLLAGALFRCINSLCGPELLGLYPAESDFAKLGYYTSGGTAVSTQHPAIDPWGAIAVPDFIRLWQLTGDERWRIRARMLWCNAILCIAPKEGLRLHGHYRPFGVQSEAFFQTRWTRYRKTCEERGHLNDMYVGWPAAFRLSALERIGDWSLLR